jgi:hypothetical protein
VSRARCVVAAAAAATAAAATTAQTDSSRLQRLQTVGGCSGLDACGNLTSYRCDASARLFLKILKL